MPSHQVRRPPKPAAASVAAMLRRYAATGRTVVISSHLLAEVEQRIRSCCSALGLRVLGWFDSAISGGEGSREFFVHAHKPL